MSFFGASVRPRHPGLEVVGARLLDRKPSVRERFGIVSDKAHPSFFLSGRDSVWFGQNTCNTSIDVLEGRCMRKHTNGSFPFRIVLFCNMVCPLVFKIRCTEVSIKVENDYCGAYFHK